MNFKITMLILLSFLITNGLLAQSVTDPESKKEIQKLSFIVGDWKGSGWTFSKDSESMILSRLKRYSSNLIAPHCLLKD